MFKLQMCAWQRLAVIERVKHTPLAEGKASCGREKDKDRDGARLELLYPAGAISGGGGGGISSLL